MSSGGDTFFGEERFPNRMKHAIVGGYVPGALTLLIERYKTDAVYGDLCAGAALYGDGHPGSPLIVARHAAQRLTEGKQHLIRCFNVEADAETHAKLVENTKEIPAEIITNRQGRWQDHSRELLALMHAKPAILFIDPFGAKGIELDDLVKILSGIGSDAWEMILRFDIGDLYRGNIAQARDLERAGKTHTLYDLPTKVFGTDKWKNLLEDHDLPSGRFDEFLKLYMDQLAEAGGKPFQQRFVASVPIPDELDGANAYYLIFITRSEKAVTMISDAVQLATERAWLEQEALEAQRVKQLGLPGIAEEIPSYGKRLAEMLARLDAAVTAYFESRPWKVSFRDVHRDMAIEFFGLFREKHLRSVVKQQRAGGKLETSVNKIDDDTLIFRKTSATSETA